MSFLRLFDCVSTSAEQRDEKSFGDRRATIRHVDDSPRDKIKVIAGHGLHEKLAELRVSNSDSISEKVKIGNEKKKSTEREKVRYFRTSRDSYLVPRRPNSIGFSCVLFPCTRIFFFPSVFRFLFDCCTSIA